MDVKLLFSVVLITSLTSCLSEVKNQPNIIVFMADDMGWNDVSFHGSDVIPTPNIDALAYYGISLNRYYTPPLCTPSRGSFLTGKYSIHLGLQRYVIPNDQPWGLDPNEKILPQYLKEAGYMYLVGKWHLGFHRTKYTPTKRGFDSFYGYYGGYIDYYSHTSAQYFQPSWPPGYDFRRNTTIDIESKGEYVTSLLTKGATDMIRTHDTTKPMFLMVNHLAPHAGNDKIPLRAPTEILNQFNYIKNPIRRTLAAVISIMDNGIGIVMKALRDRSMLDNSVILFYSDNGAASLGPFYTFGSNYPFKGQKDSPWEGAIRVPAAIWSPLLTKRERASNQLFHVTDWFPTFLKLAGITNVSNCNDGYDIWPALSDNQMTPRTSIVHNIDDYTSYMKGAYKYVAGNRQWGIFDWWIGDKILDFVLYNPNSISYYDLVRKSAVGKILSKYSLNGRPITNDFIRLIRNGSTVRCTKLRNFCIPAISPCLFNIVKDPCERFNLYYSNQEMVLEMEADISAYRKSIVPPRNQPSDSRANPKLHSNLWVPWQDDQNYYQ